MKKPSLTKVSAHAGQDKQIELVLRGYGLMALAHIGVLDVLANNGVKVHRINGMSLGAVVAALHANGWDADRIYSLFSEQGFQRFMRSAWLGGGQACNPSLSPVQDLLPIAQEFVKSHELAPRNSLRILCWDLSHGRTKIYGGTSYDLATALAAACAVPGVMRPVRDKRSLLVDCALQSCALTSRCQKRTVVSHGVMDGDPSNIQFSAVDQLVHRQSQLIESAPACSPVPKDRCLTIETKVAASLLDSCDCSDETVKRIVEAGRAAAQAALPRLTSKG